MGSGSAWNLVICRRISMTVKRLSLSLCAAALAAIPVTASDIHEFAPLFTRIARPVVIPAEVTSHGIFVNVLINSQGPFRMLVDTGCTYSMISPEVAAAVEARGADTGDDEGETTNGFGNAISVPRVLLDTISVGGVQFEGVIAGVVPLEVQSKIDSRELDGLIGYTLFSDIFFALDYPNRSLVLSGEWPKDLQPVRTELLSKEHADVPFVTMQIQGTDYDMMVDSGATGRLHLPPAMAASLNWKVEPRPGMLIAVAGEIARERVGRLTGEAQLGLLRQMEPVIDISEGPPTIGVGLLRSFCVVFHEAEDRMWLCSADSGLLPSPPERTVGMSLLADVVGWRVVSIIPNSPAEEASIFQGDLITQIEGGPAPAWTRDQIQDWVDTHNTLSIRLTTATGIRKLTLRVWNLVP